MKQCPGCGETEAKQFAKNAHRKDGLQLYCRKCKKGYDAQHYQQNKSKQIDRNRVNYQKYRGWLSDIKASVGCLKCGEPDPCGLDYHHLEGKDKAVAQLTQSPKRALDETLKCIVLCATCHRKLHAGRFELDANQVTGQRVKIHAFVAQLAAQGSLKPEVGGSSPPGGTTVL